jgi:hypothetical protein
MAAMARDRARRMRWHAAGNVLLACVLFTFVVLVAVVTKGRALTGLGIVLVSWRCSRCGCFEVA